MSTSSLPLVGSPYGHHRLPNLPQQTPSYRANSPPLSYHARNDLSYQNVPQPPPQQQQPQQTSNNYSNSAAGLVTANMGRPSGTPPPPAMHMKSHYNDQHENVTTAPTTTTELSPSSPNSSYRPLNVIDALAYLDQVKGRFSDKPNVYNKFLDIMKDFKSQS